MITIPAELTYKDYRARIETGNDEWFHGQVLLDHDTVTFKGRTLEELRREFARSIAAYEDSSDYN